jgi:hypothetical protein
MRLRFKMILQSQNVLAHLPGQQPPKQWFEKAKMAGGIQAQGIGERRACGTGDELAKTTA